MKDAIIEVIKWIRESIRPVVVILILSALILFTPHSWVAAIGIGEGFQKYRFTAVLCFVGSLVWLLTFPVEKYYRMSECRKRLDRLTQGERHVLRPFIQNAKRTQCFGWLNVAVARSLAKAGVLIETSTKDGHGNSYFEIDLRAFSYLSKHPDLVGLPKN